MHLGFSYHSRFSVARSSDPIAHHILSFFPLISKPSTIRTRRDSPSTQKQRPHILVRLLRRHPRRSNKATLFRLIATQLKIHSSTKAPKVLKQIRRLTDPTV